MLQHLFPGAQAVHPRSNIVEKLLQQADGAFDVLHFACHGLADGDKIWDASLLMTGRMVEVTTGNGIEPKYQPDPLEVAQVRASARLGADGVRPIVFLNACQVGRTGRSLSGVGGFASAFLSPKSREGAGVFVGTLWSVGDGSALSFATTFYERLQAGDTLVSATRAARNRAKDAREPTWLAYTVYGHPDAKISGPKLQPVSDSGQTPPA
jgi:CHAT domain-containing protein